MRKISYEMLKGLDLEILDVDGAFVVTGVGSESTLKLLELHRSTKNEA